MAAQKAAKTNVLPFPTKAKPKPATERQVAPKRPAKRGEAANVVNLTDGQLRRWLRDCDTMTGRAEYQDRDQPKLRARVSRSGVELSVYMWNPFAKKPQRYPIGKVTSVKALEMNVAQITKRAARIIADVGDGSDSVVKKMEAKRQAGVAGRTVADLLAEYLKEKTWGGKPLSESTRNSYSKEIPLLLGKRFNKPIGELTQAGMLKAYRERATYEMRPDKRGVMMKHGNPTGAKIALDAVAAICNFFDLPNVARMSYQKKQVAPTEVRRNRLGSKSALITLAWCWDVARVDDGTDWNDYVAMIGLSIVTGWRRRTLQELRWDWINWKRAEIDIPGWAFKGRRDYTLPLTPGVLSLLKARKAYAKGERIFAGVNGGKVLHANRYSKRLPFAASAHDGRKALSLMLAKHAPEVAANVLMTHQPKSEMVRHYIESNSWEDILEVVRPAAEKVDAEMLALVGDKAATAEGQRLHVERDAKWRANESKLGHVRRKKKKAAREAARATVRAIRA